ncbi:hypothetical protein AAG607_12155 [Citromicrobium bathyomarinum]|uniref:hypothetical protein n=1 Tax=Citromicrobium bathyomarinum TaxID=72174 RepID=UPI00315A7EC9
MASFRLLVLDFVREYLTLNGASPSYAEIAAGLECSRTRVKHAIRSLVRDRLLLQGDTPRSLAMPTERDAAIRALVGLGYRVDTDARTIAEPVTDPPLLPTSSLTYPRDGHSEDERNGDGQGKAGGGGTSGREGEASREGHS